MGETEVRGESQTPSASSRLVEALSRPKEPMEVEETEPTEARAPKRAVSPEDPTDAEIEAHKLSGHACFRSWCRHCVRGRGCEAPHSRIETPESAVPTISWDYCYLSSSRDAPEPSSENESPVLVMWDSRTKGLFAHIVPAKGTDFEGLDAVLKLFAADLDRLGYKRLASRNDTEPAIVAFLRELRKYWSGEVVPEAASTGDPQSNGAAEAAVRLIKGRVKTLKDALEFNLSSATGATQAQINHTLSSSSTTTTELAAIPPTSGLMTLIVRQAAAVQRLYSQGADGRTPHERSTGRNTTPLSRSSENLSGGCPSKLPQINCRR